MPRALCPVLFALAATLGAADGDVRVADVRIGVGVGSMPDVMNGQVTDPASMAGQDWKAEYDSTPGLSITIGGMYGRLSPVGLMAGWQLRSTTGEMALDSLAINGAPETAEEIEQRTGDKVPAMSFSQTGIAANVGVGWALSPSWHIEVAGILGLDWTTWDCLATFGPGSTNLSVADSDGWGYTYGGRCGVYWTDPETSWQFGLEGEYTASKGDLDLNYVNEKVEADLDYSGASFRAVFGHRF